MNRHYQSESRQARVAVYAATQSTTDQRYLLQSFVAISATLLLWLSLLH